MSYSPNEIKNQFPLLNAGENAGLHYLDNAATSQVPQSVLDAMMRHDTTARANVKRGVHRLAERATQGFEAARQTMADFVNAGDAREIVFTSGTTDAINIVAHALIPSLGAGEALVFTALDHHSNIVPWQLAASRSGAQTRAVGVTSDGRIDTALLETVLDDSVRLVALPHISNVTGAVTDFATLVPIIRSKAPKALILVDGAQAAPHGGIDVQALGVDFYALSAHKMYGPTGAGILWGRYEALDALPPFKGGGEMIASVALDNVSFRPPPHKFEAGTPPITQVIGMAEAARFVLALPHDEIERALAKLLQKLEQGLQSRFDDKLTRLGPPADAPQRAPILSFAIKGVHPHDLCQIVDAKGVAVRGGHHCAQPLMDHFGLAGTVRASLAPYNTEEDIDALLEALSGAVNLLTGV